MPNFSCIILFLLFSFHGFAIEDKFEIKLRLASESIGDSLSKLNLRKTNALKEKIYVLDTKNLELMGQSIFLRVKINEIKKEIETNIKVNGLHSGSLDPRFHSSEGLKCETNVTPIKRTQSCSIIRRKI